MRRIANPVFLRCRLQSTACESGSDPTFLFDKMSNTMCRRMSTVNGELVRIIDSIHRDKDIDSEVLFLALEEAMLSAARKHYGDRESISVTIDRKTGAMSVRDGAEELNPASLGRIVAQTAKQVMIQRIREAERDVLYKDYEDKLREIVNGTVQRVEGSTIVVNLGKTEGILPRREQIPDETFRAGDRIRAYVLDVKMVGSRVRIILSRTHPELIKRLFELEVPEIIEHVIEVKALAREPGHRTKIAVSSSDQKVDPVGACVGVRGTRIKNIVNELGGEKIDIVRWSDDAATFIAFALKPAEVSSITLSHETRKARIVVDEEQLSLAIGRRGQNVRLAAKLSGWDIDVMTAEEVAQEEQDVRSVLGDIEELPDEVVERIVKGGLGVRMLATCAQEDLAEIEGMTPEMAEVVIATCVEVVRASAQAEDEARAEEEAQSAEALSEEEPESEETPEEVDLGTEEPREGEVEQAGSTAVAEEELPTAEDGTIEESDTQREDT